MPVEPRKEIPLRTMRKNRWELVAIAVFFGVGIFLRTYHFSDWLHFEIDQAFDYELVSPAVDHGIGNLPLLGPNVGGGMLRLGPAFYYMEYASAIVFGNTPTGHAMNILLLSILALPLFYLFCRRYFPTIQSIGLLAIFSVSLYLVMYSRFSWSPNVLPFLVLLSFYALLRGVSPRERHPARWFLVAVAMVAVTSQIHFNSFFVIPIIAIIFTAINRPRFRWKVWLATLGIVFLVYSPAILNDVKTNRENLHYLKEKFVKTSPGSFIMPDTLVQTVEYGAYEFFFINTANDQINGIKLKDYGFEPGVYGDGFGLKILALALSVFGSVVLIIRTFRETDADRKNFLILISLWLAVSFYLIYSIADGYRMYPRFFLLLSPLAILLYGFILELFGPEKSRLRLVAFSIVILALVGLNLRAIAPAFATLRNTAPMTESADIETGDIFPNTNRITLSQEQGIVDYIVSKHDENGYPVYLDAKSEYEPAFWALLERRGIGYSDEVGDSSLYTEGNYFDIRFSDDSFDPGSDFTVLETRPFGTLTVTRFQPLETVVIGTRQSDTDRKRSVVMSDISKLLTWDSLFK
ncbi:MAG: glycosyltransferase family 39 protein [Candidatus Moraniibacteriota bacterium]